MNRQELDEIRQRVEAATKGTWRTANTGYSVRSDVDVIPNVGNIICLAPNRIDKKEEHLKKWLDNADFISHARTDIPKLLAYIDELEARCGTN